MTTTAYQLRPRTELFAIATHARARALSPETPSSQRHALLQMVDEWGWAAHHCYPGGPWERSNLKVVFLLADAWREADAAGLPPFDLANPAAFLLDTAVTELRNIYADRPQVTEVEFTAGPFGKRIEWGTITSAVTRYADGTERDNISYPGPRLHHFLYDLAVLRPPATGDTLTLRIAPGPSALPELDVAEPTPRPAYLPSLLDYHDLALPHCTCPKAGCGGAIVGEATREAQAACPFHSRTPTTSCHQGINCPKLPPGTDLSHVWIVVLNEVRTATGRAIERTVPYEQADRSELGPRHLQHLVEAESADSAEAVVRAQLSTWNRI
ncbi:hypothetical protein [Streptomyces mirabilis]|uniref:hypothetical protein n=1 Tax=Streptomyces mirabilis TaxID=68239 RepID=UPI0033EB74CC